MRSKLEVSIRIRPGVSTFGENRRTSPQYIIKIWPYRAKVHNFGLYEDLFKQTNEVEMVEIFSVPSRCFSSGNDRTFRKWRNREEKNISVILQFLGSPKCRSRSNGPSNDMLPLKGVIFVFLMEHLGRFCCLFVFSMFHFCCLHRKNIYVRGRTVSEPFWIEKIFSK